jgi:hypothetical protein
MVTAHSQGFRPGPLSYRIVYTYPTRKNLARAGPMAEGMQARFWRIRAGAMQDLGYELPRISLLGTWVDKGKKKGRGC